jgi:acetyl esterase/lipase
MRQDVITMLTAVNLMFGSLVGSTAFGERQEVKLWPGVAPGETTDNDGPRLFLFQPEKKTSDVFVLIAPGGCYEFLAIDHEGWRIAEYFNRQGMTAGVLKYRVPKRKGQPKHLAAWQDAQRAVRVVRSNSALWGINAEKIGILGFSAGGHLALMTSTTSQTPAYPPVDDLDKIPCHVNFAVPVYPAYVLEAEAEGVSKTKVTESKMVSDFAFDSRTPPMCLVFGDADPYYSPLGAIAVYQKLRTRGIPAELHIFAKSGHGFGADDRTRDPNNKHLGDWLNRVYEALKALGFR